METNIENNNEKINDTEQPGGFWHSGWAFLVFFIGIIGLLMVISYIVKQLF